MSTFCGIMSEMDFISIDRFTDQNLKSRAFFLSHCHKDHMSGLDTREFESALIQNNAYLYMSHISKLIMDKMYPFLTPRIRELHIPGINFIDIPDINKIINVILVPAGHCPGSVMFLFESDNKILLYTGDIRIRVNELKKYKNLYDLTGNLKKIDNIYLDTTFFKKSFDYFPLREESIKAFCDFINDWLKKDDKNVISILSPATYGSEYLFIETYRNCGMPIHVDYAKYKLYQCFPEMDDVVTLHASKTRIHNYCIGYNNSNKICLNYCDYNILNIKPSAQVWKNMNVTDCIVKNSYSNIKSVCYSSHSSYSEIIDILKFLKPLKITPCVEPTEFSEKQEMNQLINDTLEEIHKVVNSESEKSDEEFSNKLNWDKQKSISTDKIDKENDDCDIFHVLDSPELKRKKMD